MTTADGFDIADLPYGEELLKADTTVNSARLKLRGLRFIQGVFERHHAIGGVDSTFMREIEEAEEELRDAHKHQLLINALSVRDETCVFKKYVNEFPDLLEEIVGCALDTRLKTLHLQLERTEEELLKVWEEDSHFCPAALSDECYKRLRESAIRSAVNGAVNERYVLTMAEPLLIRIYSRLSEEHKQSLEEMHKKYRLQIFAPPPPPQEEPAEVNPEAEAAASEKSPGTSRV